MIHMKRGYLLFSVIILLILFGYYSIKIVQNHIFHSNIDKLKYLEIQSLIHLKKYEIIIYSKNDKNAILNYTINDQRFQSSIKSCDFANENNTTTEKYCVVIKAKNEPIRIYKEFTK